ncbi:MAG: class I SAM-dependent methyltransferase [Nitrospirota bacterium]
MIDWTSISHDPNDPIAKARVLFELRRIQRVHIDTDLVGFVERAASGRRVLDIGMADPSGCLSESWRHPRFAKAASYCLGIDVSVEIIDRVARQGFNVRAVDATSDVDLGERFDLVFNGDVIEHVESPIRLMRFAARHLTPGGRILVSTPNPFSRKFYRRFRRDNAMIVNLDHVAWFTPTMAMEIARRSGLHLEHVHLVKPLSGFKRMVKPLTWVFEPVEYSFHDFLYEFTRSP